MAYFRASNALGYTLASALSHAHRHSQRGRGYDPAQKVWGGLLASSTVHQDRRAKEADGVSRQLRHAEPLTDDVPEPWWRVWSRPSCANPK